MKSKTHPHDLILKAAQAEKTEAPSALPEREPDLSLDLAEHQLFYQVKRLEQQLQEAQDTHKLRLRYADKIFWLVCAWLVGVVIAIFLSGLNAFGFKLSDNVLIAFITSTTVTVVGLFAVVAKWMFPNSKDKSS